VAPKTPPAEHEEPSAPPILSTSINKNKLINKLSAEKQLEQILDSGRDSAISILTTKAVELVQK